MRTSARILTVGYQGFGNVGDEAILTGLEEVLPKDIAEVMWVACGSAGPVVAFRGAARLPLPGLIPRLRFLRALARADVLLIAGGGLINDYWLTLIPRYLLWTLLARVFGTRVVWWAIGVGPIRRRPWRWLASGMLRMAHFVTVRDPASSALLDRIAPSVARITVPDPAYFNPAPESISPRSGLAIIVRGPAPGDEPAMLQWARSIAELLREGGAIGEDVTLLTMQTCFDAAAVEAVRAECGAHRVSVTKMASMASDPAAAIEQLASFEAVISARLHGLILASIAGTPCVPIVYDPKVAAAATQLGLGDIAVPMAQSSGPRLAAALREARTPARIQTVRLAVDRARQARRETQERLRAALDPQQRAC